MAQTLEQLQAQRDSLLRAIANGLDSITKGATSMRWKSGADMQLALNRIDSEIAAISGGVPSRVFTIQTNRGIE